MARIPKDFLGTDDSAKRVNDIKNKIKFEEDTLENFFNVKNVLRMVAVALVLIILPIFMRCTRVHPGYVGIKVNMVGSARGVDNLPLQTGYIFYSPFLTQVLKFPTYVQTAKWCRTTQEGNGINEEFSFNSKDSMTVTADVSLSYQLKPSKIPAFYVKFRTDDLENFTHGMLRNFVRDAFSEIAPYYTVDEIYTIKREEFMLKVRQRIEAQTGDIGVEITQFGFMNNPRPPNEYIQAANLKVTAIQKAQQAENELREAQAQAKKVVATAEGAAAAKIAEATGNATAKVTMAEGEAKANKLLQSSITSNVMEWRKLDITAAAVSQWNGQRPQVEGAGSGLLLNITPQK
jgi:regulator of protease activity HflC (stomatin/prohibitin superfamily)